MISINELFRRLDQGLWLNTKLNRLLIFQTVVIIYERHVGQVFSYLEFSGSLAIGLSPGESLVYWNFFTAVIPW